MIIITGGGTGGHLIIAKNLAIEFKKMGESCVFIGSNSGQDRAWFENSEIFEKCYFLDSSGVVNKRGVGKIFSLLKIIKLAFFCLKIFKTHGAKKIVSVGGYSAAAASFAAIFGRKLLFIHEQNAILGRLNQLLKPFCARFFSSYFGNFDPYPVGERFFKAGRIRTDKGCVIFLGGSQGARFINDLAICLAVDLTKMGIKIIHQCGASDFERVCGEYEKMGVGAEVLGFCENIEKYMNMADICVGRAGASTLWELCANTLPAIFVPYPYAAKNHQFYNAKFLADKNLAVICEQNEATREKILEIIKNMDIFAISNGLKGVAKMDAASKMAVEILNFGGKNAKK